MCRASGLDVGQLQGDSQEEILTEAVRARTDPVRRVDSIRVRLVPHQYRHTSRIEDGKRGTPCRINLTRAKDDVRCVRTTPMLWITPCSRRDALYWYPPVKISDGAE